MGGLDSIKAFLGVINSDGNEKITQEELKKAEGKVPSVFLQKVSALADGKDIAVETVIKGMGVESEQGSDTKTQGTFRKENYFDYYPEEENFSQSVPKLDSLDKVKIATHENAWDVRGYDISKMNLTKEQLLNCTIDKSTVLSAEQRQIIQEHTEKMKDPGLGVRNLHVQGITGKGVKIAIIDQPLGMHKEYADNVVHHESINCEEMGWTNASLHGAAVTSIAVGNEVGVAPDADLVYFSAVNATKDKAAVAKQEANLRAKLAAGVDNSGLEAWYNNQLARIEENGEVLSNLSYAQAIEKVLDMNKELPDGEKIPVISISWGFERDGHGWDKLQEVLQRAKDEGVFVVSTSLDQTHGFDTCGANRDPQLDPNNPESYEAGAFWKENSGGNAEENDKLLLFPMDHRTTADFLDDSSFRYEGNDGGMSWSTPYIAATYVLAKQVNPDITPEEFWEKALETSDACNNNDGGAYVGRLINPERLIEAVKVE